MAHRDRAVTLKAILDTSSLMSRGAEKFLTDELGPLLREAGQMMLLPSSVVHELNRNLRNNRYNTRCAARRALTVLERLRRHGLIHPLETRDTFADGSILSYAAGTRTRHSILLVTQDRHLASDFLQLGLQKSVRSPHNLLAVRVTDDGKGEPWELHAGIASASGPVTKPPKAPHRDSVPASYRLATGAPRKRGVPLKPSSTLPGTGSRIRTAKERGLRLRRRLGGGGEGTVYATDDPSIVCKVYNAERLTSELKNKIELMVTRPISVRGVCWPVDVALNRHGEFVGCVQPKAEGRGLQKCVFIKPELTREFPHWTRRQLVALAQGVLGPIVKLHAHNILIGDINGLNILVKDEKTVHFVDVDSYQVENHACPVGTPTFLSPELIGVDVSRSLRTTEQERFAVATLVFMISMCGKPPYSHQGGGDPTENIRNRHFPYPLGDIHGNGVPTGPWAKIWSNLPYFLKSAFHSAFAGASRPSASDWLKHMDHYAHDLDKGHVSSELFPTAMKEISPRLARRQGGHASACRACGQTIYVLPGRPREMCNRCVEEPVACSCALCGDPFASTAGAVDRHGRDRVLCPSCLSPKLRTCCDCQSQFKMNGGERLFFRNKGYSEPRRCPTCRKRRRQQTPSLLLWAG